MLIGWKQTLQPHILSVQCVNRLGQHMADERQIMKFMQILFMKAGRKNKSLIFTFVPLLACAWLKTVF